MRFIITIVFLALFNSIVSAQETQVNLSYTISEKVSSKIYLETGDYINNLNQKESYFQIVLQEGIENIKSERSVILECSGDKNSGLFESHLSKIVKYFNSNSTSEFSEIGNFNNFIITANNNFEVAKIQNLESSKSIVLNLDEIIKFILVLNREAVKRGNI